MDWGHFKILNNYIISKFFRSPFELPQKNAMGSSKKTFSDETTSDHKLLYHVFQGWENSARKYQFCNEYMLSYSTMEVINGIKQQIISQLQKTEMLKDFKSSNENR